MALWISYAFEQLLFCFCSVALLLLEALWQTTLGRAEPERTARGQTLLSLSMVSAWGLGRGQAAAPAAAV